MDQFDKSIKHYEKNKYGSIRRNVSSHTSLRIKTNDDMQRQNSMHSLQKVSNTNLTDGVLDSTENMRTSQQSVTTNHPQNQFLSNSLSIQGLSFMNRSFMVMTNHSQRIDSYSKLDENFINLKVDAKSKENFQNKRSVSTNAFYDTKSIESESTTTTTSSDKPLPPNRTSSLIISNSLETNGKSNLNYTPSYSSNMSKFNSFRLRNPSIADFYSSTVCTDHDVFKVESCYRSMGSTVFVAKSVAELYSTSLKELVDLSDWNYLCTGIPTWVFNTGLNLNRSKGLTFILAQKLTGFTLTKIDSVTYKNNFKRCKPEIITFYATNDLDMRFKFTNERNQNNNKNKTPTKKETKQQNLFALKFFSEYECSKFYDHFLSLSTDPKNRDLFDIKYNKKKHSSIVGRSFRRKITKSAISMPCGFKHINSVPLDELSDAMREENDEIDSVSMLSNQTLTSNGNNQNS